jgi:hypothetical protein
MNLLDQFITDLDLIQEEASHLSQDQLKKLQSIKAKVSELVKKVESYPVNPVPQVNHAAKLLAEGRVIRFSEYHELNEMIKKRGSKWVVTDKSGKKVLGTHPSREKALKQLRAIEISKMRG